MQLPGPFGIIELSAYQPAPSSGAMMPSHRYLGGRAFFSDECRGGSGESDQIDKWCSVVTTGTKPTPTKEQPITDRNTDRIRTK